jgi:hypothetical protein
VEDRASLHVLFAGREEFPEIGGGPAQAEFFDQFFLIHVI